MVNWENVTQGLPWKLELLGHKYECIHCFKDELWDANAFKVDESDYLDEE